MHILNHNNDLFVGLKYKSSTRHHGIQHLIKCNRNSFLLQISHFMYFETCKTVQVFVYKD